MKLPRPAWNVNSPHKYGVWTSGEAVFMDRLLAQVAREFGEVRFCEIGVAEGATMAGIFERCDEIGTKCTYVGVDGVQGKPAMLPDGATFVEGDSAQVFMKVNGPFNILFIDGSHNNNYVILDFCNYSPKVDVNGYVLFHDTREGDKWQGVHYQGTGPDIPEFRIAVRMGLKKLGLLDGFRSDWKFIEEVKDADIQGMMLFKRLL